MDEKYLQTNKSFGEIITQEFIDKGLKFDVYGFTETEKYLIITGDEAVCSEYISKFDASIVDKAAIDTLLNHTSKNPADEKISKLENDLALTKQALDELIFMGGAF